MISLVMSVLLCLGTQAGGGQDGLGVAQRIPATRDAAKASVVVLVFDTDGMSAGSLGQARSAAENLIRTGLDEGQLVGLVAGGRLLGNRFTANRDELLKEVSSIKPGADLLARQGDVPLDRGDARAAEIASLFDEANRQAADSQSRTAARTLPTLQALTKALALRPGPTTIVWISDSFSSPNREKVAGRESQVKQFLEAASRASVRIVGLGVKGASPLAPGDLWQALISGTGGSLVGKEEDLPSAVRAASGDANTPRADMVTAQPGISAAPPMPIPPPTPASTPVAAPESRPAPPPVGVLVVAPASSSRDPGIRDTLSGSGGTLPPDLLEQARKGWDAYQTGDTKGARAALLVCAAHPSAPAWVHYVLGWAQFAEGDIDAARDQWNLVRTAVPVFVRVYFDLADCDLRQQRPARALNVLVDAARRWPSNTEVLHAVGVVQSSLTQYDDAVATFEHAVALDPADPNGHFNLARTYELRYVQTLSDPRRVKTKAPPTTDLERASAAYRRVVEMNAPAATISEARAGLLRTTPFDATRVQTDAPATVGSYNDAALGGYPMRLAWSPDSRQVCTGVVRWGPSGKVVSQETRVITIADGHLDVVAQVPDWAAAYWIFKSSLVAQWLPSLVIYPERGRLSSMYGMGAPQSVQADAFRFQGELIGESTNRRVFEAGTSFGWAPYAMGAIAFVDRRGVLVIIDRNGHKHDIKGAQGTIILPAWSPDGASIAYLEKSTRGYDLRIVNVSVR